MSLIYNRSTLEKANNRRKIVLIHHIKILEMQILRHMFYFCICNSSQYGCVSITFNNSKKAIIESNLRCYKVGNTRYNEFLCRL